MVASDQGVSTEDSPLCLCCLRGEASFRIMEEVTLRARWAIDMSNYPLKLPASLKRAAERLAKQDGVSLNQWIAAAVAEKVGAIEATDFFERRANGTDGSGLHALLDQIPVDPPIPGDELAG